jgi:hypothetical protein
LRTPSEKIVIENWKAKNQKKEETDTDDHDGHDEAHGEHH